MKKQKLPRLTLTRETLRQLEQPALRWVAGCLSGTAGAIDEPCGTNTSFCVPRY